MRAIRLSAFGGAEALSLAAVELAPPGPGQVRIRHTAIGLNFIDIYQRSGLYPVPLPTTLGLEAAGVVSGVGEGVEDLRLGDRVGYATGPLGAYAEEANVPSGRTVRLPEDISDETAAAVLLKGMTAEFLIRRCRQVQAGDTVVFHAAAGGVGLIACQWLNALGAHVIGTVGTPEKAALAKANGCVDVVLYREESLVERVRAIVPAGADVVYDSVGADTIMASLDCLKRRGTLVSFGNASGPPPLVSPLELSRRGSLFLTRPTLFDYVATTQELRASAAALFEAIRSGAVRVEIGARWELAEAASAHRALEARQTTGSSLLIP